MSRIRLAASLLLASVTATVSAEPGDGRQAELMYLLRQDCGSCHGLTLNGGLGPALLPEALAGKPRQALIETILAGRTGTAMPPWRGLLSRDEAEWITDQLIEGVN